SISRAGNDGNRREHRRQLRLIIHLLKVLLEQEMLDRIRGGRTRSEVQQVAAQVERAPIFVIGLVQGLQRRDIVDLVESDMQINKAIHGFESTEVGEIIVVEHQGLKSRHSTNKIDVGERVAA